MLSLHLVFSQFIFAVTRKNL